MLHHVHILGIGGTLMGAFAAYLQRKGIQVTGSDQKIYPPMSHVLENAGIRVYQGYAAENLDRLPHIPDLVVIGNVISANNAEMQAVLDKGWLYASLPETLEKLILAKTKNLVIAGTHGKTTTTSLLAHVLVTCAKDPSYFIGGVPKTLPFSFHISGALDLVVKEFKSQKEHYFILEGDEYDTAFWDKVPKFFHYCPHDLLLTSIEYDHADIYPDLDAVLRAFEGLLTRVRSGGRIVACFDYQTIRTLLETQASVLSAVEILSYGSGQVAMHGEATPRFTPKNIRHTAVATTFDVCDQGCVVDTLTVQIPGMHNILNTLAVWIECQALGLPKDQVRAALESFTGVQRRQEVTGIVRDITVIDDFAHHPTAVRETLRALRAKYPQKKLIVVFEPRSASSRRKVFQKDYVQAFQEADHSLIAVPFDQTRIAMDQQFSSEMLVNDLVLLGKNAELMPAVDLGIKRIIEIAHRGDVIAVLSNGGFGGLIQKLLKALKA
jgi:UDP-N-acetylmuramate: L-alanyl-gamma-D-glutamyl-meso-diaminopimelate ligase